MAQIRKIIIGVVAVIVMAIAVFAAWPQSQVVAPDYQRDAVERAEPSSTFTLAINFGDGTVNNFAGVQFSSGENLFEVLQRKMAEEKISFEFKEYPGLGMLVTRIGEKKNGEQGKYWQYWVNGKYAEKGPDAYMVMPGDSIEWKFEGSKQ